MSTAAPLDYLESPGMGRAFDALVDRRRRVALITLQRRTTLAETDLMFRGQNEREDIESDLVQNHLPKLEEAGYIEWDRETGTISKGPRFHEIEPLLELMADHADELPPGWP